MPKRRQVCHQYQTVGLSACSQSAQLVHLAHLVFSTLASCLDRLYARKRGYSTETFVQRFVSSLCLSALPLRRGSGSSCYYYKVLECNYQLSKRCRIPGSTLIGASIANRALQTVHTLSYQASAEQSPWETGRWSQEQHAAHQSPAGNLSVRLPPNRFV